VLQQAGVVGHGVQVPQADLRQAELAARERRHGQDRPRVAGARPDRALEGGVIPRRHRRPAHLAAVSGAPGPQRVAPRIVREEGRDRGADRGRVPPGHQDAAILGEQLARVDVRRRDDRAPRAHGVGERPGRALRGIQVRRDVDVGGAEELVQLFLADEPVVEDHVILDAEPPGLRLERHAIRLALVLAHVRVRGAEHDVDRVRPRRHDARQRLDDVLDALVGRQQPESQEHRAPVDAEPPLALSAVGHVRDAVRDHVDRGARHAMDRCEQLGAVLAHHHQPLRELRQLVDHAALRQAGLAQDRVQRRHDRHAQLAQEGDQVAAGLAAEDAELVLHRDDVDAVDVQVVGGPPVRRRIGLADLEADARGVAVALARVVHRDDEAVDRRRRVEERAGEVRRERGDAALSRQVIAEHADAPDQRVGRVASGGAPRARGIVDRRVVDGRGVGHGEPRSGRGDTGALPARVAARRKEA
jgi:hypothetical protein